jgi:lipopolysaccharide transport system ATP-binding protein
MSSFVKLTGVTLDYHIYSVRAQSLRSAMLNLAIGGKLYRGQSDVTVVRALENINFEVHDGDRLALIGHNGSGKTSLLKVIAGVYEPGQGRVETRGTLTSMIAHASGLDADSTGLQNIRKIGQMRMIPDKVIDSRVDSIVEFSGLGHFIKLPVKTYSAGMMARLMFACATEFEADILVLDEWLSAGDFAFMQKAGKRMMEFVEKARIVIIGTHDMQLVQRVCNRVLVLDGGRVAFEGGVDEWVAQQQAQAA